MPINASTLNTDVLKRINDPNAQMVATDTPPTNATGLAFVYTMLSIAQDFVNVGERLVTNVGNLSIATNQTLYNFFAGVEPVDYGAIILSVTDNNNREIPRMEMGALGRSDRFWFTSNSSFGADPPAYALGWAMIGKTSLVVWPQFFSTTPTFTFRYVTWPAAVTSSSTMTVPDDATEHVARLAELLCRIKTRQLTDFDKKLKLLEADMKLTRQMSDTGSKAD